MTQVPGTMHSLSIAIFVTVKQAWQIVHHCFTEISGGSLVFHYNHVLTLFTLIAKKIAAFLENLAYQRPENAVHETFTTGRRAEGGVK